MMTVMFNTGRQYTAHGQRIIATLHDDLVVTFHDIDRMIDGEFELASLALWMMSKEAAAMLVMRHYDNGQALGSPRSHLDAFQRDGANRATLWEDQE